MTIKVLKYTFVFVLLLVTGTTVTHSFANVEREALPVPSQTERLIFEDDFSTNKGWIDDSTGTIYRDPVSKTLTWDVDNATEGLYYVPIDGTSDYIHLTFRFQLFSSEEGGGIRFGLAEELSGAYHPRSPYNGTGPIGFFVGMLKHAEMGDWVFPWTTHLPGELDEDLTGGGDWYSYIIRSGAFYRWRQVDLVIHDTVWTLKLMDSTGNLLGTQEGVLPTQYQQFKYLVLYNDFSNWPPSGGQFDDVAVYGRPSEAAMPESLSDDAASVTANADPDEETRIALPDGAAIVIPPDSLTDESVITVEANPPKAASLPPLDSEVMPLGDFYNFEISGGSLIGPVELHLPLNPERIPYDPGMLVAAFPTDNGWEYVPVVPEGEEVILYTRQLGDPLIAWHFIDQDARLKAAFEHLAWQDRAMLMSSALPCIEDIYLTVTPHEGEPGTEFTIDGRVVAGFPITRMYLDDPLFFSGEDADLMEQVLREFYQENVEGVVDLSEVPVSIDILYPEIVASYTALTDADGRFTISVDTSAPIFDVPFRSRHDFGVEATATCRVDSGVWYHFNHTVAGYGTIRMIRNPQDSAQVQETETPLPTPDSPTIPVGAVEIPDVTGLDIDVAIQTLEELGFGTTWIDGSSEYDLGQVYDQAPDAGTYYVPRRTTVVLYRTTSQLPETEVPEPATATPTQQSVSSEPCKVWAERDNVVVRVGPGLRRGNFAFMPVNEAISVIGQARADDGSLWWNLDKDEIAGGYLTNSLWVADQDIRKRGGCNVQSVPEANIPPIIERRPTPIPPTAAPQLEPAPEQSITSGEAQIAFWAERMSIQAGQCTNLRWVLKNIESVYLDGQPTVGEYTKQVCPSSTTTYTLTIFKRDGSRVSPSVTIRVSTSDSVQDEVDEPDQPPATDNRVLVYKGLRCITWEEEDLLSLVSLEEYNVRLFCSEMYDQVGRFWDNGKEPTSYVWAGTTYHYVGSCDDRYTADGQCGCWLLVKRSDYLNYCR